MPAANNGKRVLGNKGNIKHSKIAAEIDRVTALYQNDSTQFTKFSEFPLSSLTQKGLRDAGYVEPTEIQCSAIPLALRGVDVLAAAKTGSGKTLAFIVPVLECLWRQRWSQLDGLGILVVSPTRELAYQTFEVLRKVGAHHDFSAALIVGGTDWQYEKARIDRSNIIIGTPGRLLQHMDESTGFSCLNLQMLVLDEADRVLDLGFEEQLNAILENLPAERQTLLFSATQTKSVKDLARLSLKNPQFVCVHEESQYATPEQLVQSYVVCEDHDKVNLLWSFIRNHLRRKVLVFLTTCKQVRYMYEAFRKLRPGMSILALYGIMNAGKRVSVFEEFCRKQHAVLLATDIAARGLDFPAVDWVVQLDCPAEVTEYIHRVGRTARYKNSGEALLVLSPFQERPMLKLLKQQKIPIGRIDINQKKIYSIQRRLEELCVQDNELKVYAQRCFVSYFRATFLAGNKRLFDVGQINAEALARSLGLAMAPRLRFLRGGVERVGKSTPAEQTLRVDSDDDVEKPTTLAGRDDGDDDDALLVVKRTDVFATKLQAEKEKEEEEPDVVASQRPNDVKKERPLTRPQIARKAKKKNIRLNRKIVFGDDGDVCDVSVPSTSAEIVQDNDPGGLNIIESKRLLEEADVKDKQAFRLRQKEKHRLERLKRKQMDVLQRTLKKKRRNDAHTTDVVEARLGVADDDDDDSSGGEGPDLSWLPDPDSYATTASSSPSGAANGLPKHRHRNAHTGMSLAHDEELAMKLLS